MGGKNSSTRQHQQRELVNESWLYISKDPNGLITYISEDRLNEGAAPPEDTQEAELEEILSEGAGPPEETGCETQLEEVLNEGIAPPEDTRCETQLGITTGDTDPGGETETERSGEDHEEHVPPPCQKIDLLQAVPYTSQQVSQAASDPAVTTNEADPSGETGTERSGEDHEVHVPPPCRKIDLEPYTSQQVSQSASDPAVTTNEADPSGETGTERSGDDHEEHVPPPCRKIDLLQAEPSTSQQVSQSASDPAVTTNEADPGGETRIERSGEDHEEHVPPPCRKIDLEPYTSQQVSQSASDPAVTTNEADPSGETGTERSGDDHEDPAVATSGIDETGQGERDKEQIPPSQETVTPQHDTGREHSTMNAACSDLTRVRPQTTDPERAKAVAARETLQAHSYALSKCIKSSALASGLYSHKIINSEDYELASNPVYGTERERALILLVKVIQQLERKPKWFHTVCDILKKEGVSIKKLKCDYQRKYDELTGAKPSEVLTSDSESGSEVDSNSPAVESQGPVFLQQACGSGSSMTNLTNSEVKESTPTEHSAVVQSEVPSLVDMCRKAMNCQGEGEPHTFIARRTSVYHSNDGNLLHRALDNGYCNLFNVLCSHLTDTEVNAQDKDEQTPLHLACQKSDAHAAEMLLRHSTDCLRARNKNKDTPLHIACFEGALDVVNVLLKHKADPHIQNKDGNTPLHLACLNVQVAQRLVSYDGSTADAIDQKQNTPLHLACQKPITSATLVIILQNKRIDKYNSDGFTTLHLASSCGNFAVVKQLLKLCRTDSFVNCQNKDGNTALHLACQKGFEEVVSLLLKSKYKAKRERRNFANKTPIDVARENQHMTVVQCLDPQKNFFFRHTFRKTY